MREDTAVKPNYATSPFRYYTLGGAFRRESNPFRTQQPTIRQLSV